MHFNAEVQELRDAYRVAKFVRRHRGGVAAAAVIVVLLLSGISGTSWQASVAAAERDVARAQRDRAERMFNQVREIAHAAAEPAEAMIQGELAITLMRVGDVQMHSGQLADAFAIYQRAIRIAESAAQADRKLRLGFSPRVGLTMFNAK